jgi:hypothetical protein
MHLHISGHTTGNPAANFSNKIKLLKEQKDCSTIRRTFVWTLPVKKLKYPHIINKNYTVTLGSYGHRAVQVPPAKNTKGHAYIK